MKASDCVEVDPAIPNLSGCRVFIGKDGTLYIELPRELQRPCPLPCSCSDCTAGDEPSTWNMLAVHKSSAHSWTVHFPRKAVEHGLRSGLLKMAH